MKKIYNFIIKTHVIYLLIPIGIYLFKAQLYHFNRVHGTDNYHVVNMKIDDIIPFCKYFAVFYVSYYWLPQFMLWVLSFYDKKKYWILTISFALSCVLANVFFYFYNVKMDLRATVDGNDIFSYLVKWVYNKDKSALNCFPSIHAVLGVTLFLVGFRTKNIPKYWKVIALVFGIGTVLSTVFVKQHYFVDMIAGVVLAVIVYIITAIIFNHIVNKRKLKEDK